MLENVEGIVYGETNYGESSKIINVLTKDGTISMHSRGCRKINSMLRSVSNKMIYANFHIKYKKDKISTLVSADVIDDFRYILSNISTISYSSYILELCKIVSEQTDDKENVYNLLISALKKINEQIDPMVIANIVELKLLDFLGVPLEVNQCVVCGSTKDIVTISSSKSGLLCSNCVNDEFILNEKTVKLIRLLSLVNIDLVSNISIHDNIKREINDFIDDYYDRYTGIYVKSKEILKNLLILGK